jgi:hypothetical protein
MTELAEQDTATSEQLVTSEGIEELLDFSLFQQ